MNVTGPKGANSIRQTKMRSKRPEQQSHSNTFAIQLYQQQPSDRVCVPSQSVKKSQESIAARLKLRSGSS